MKSVIRSQTSRLHGWNLRIDKKFHPKQSWACDYLEIYSIITCITIYICDIPSVSSSRSTPPCLCWNIAGTLQWQQEWFHLPWLLLTIHGAFWSWMKRHFNSATSKADFKSICYALWRNEKLWWICLRWCWDISLLLHNSLSPEICSSNCMSVILKHILMIDTLSISIEITLSWIQHDFTDDKSTLVQVLAISLLNYFHISQGPIS